MLAGLVLAVLVAASMAACAGPNRSPSPTPPGPTASGVVALRTQEPHPSGTAQVCMAALIEGALVRDARSGVGLRTPQGPVEQVIWPNGFSARDDAGRLAVLDAAGKAVAHEGDRVSIGGGEIAQGTWLACGGPTVLAP